ncbi:MAG: hypothetical protein ACQKBT_10410, partial [Puniceicoccales bacterium]
CIHAPRRIDWVKVCVIKNAIASDGYIVPNRNLVAADEGAVADSDVVTNFKTPFYPEYAVALPSYDIVVGTTVQL